MTAYSIRDSIVDPVLNKEIKMLYILLPILGILALITVALILQLRGRFYKYSLAFLALGTMAIAFFVGYRAEVCTEGWCSLGNFIAGTVIALVSFMIASILAAFSKNKPARSRKKH